MKLSSLIFSPRLCAILGGLMFCFSVARADEIADALKTFDAAVRQEAAEQKAAAAGKTPTITSGRIELNLMTLGQLHSSIDNGETQSINIQLSQIMEGFTSEAVRTAGTKLREDLRAQREAKEQSTITRLRDQIEQARNAVAHANKAADLDQVLRDLAEMHGQTGYPASDAVRNESGNVEKARQFVIYWQDYLVNRDGGNTQAAIEKLQNASSGGSNVLELLPRSEILTRIQDLKTRKEHPAGNPVDEIIERTKTLDDVPAAVLAIADLQRAYNDDYNARNLLESLGRELQFIGRVYGEYKAGLPVPGQEFFNRTDSSTLLPQKVLELRAQLMRLVFARQLDAGEKLQPGAQEPVQDYLARVMDDARGRCDARLILRVRELQSISGRQQEPYDATNALQNLLAAQNQEEAGQFVPAIISYEAALKTGSSLVPAKVVGERLDAIKAAHPAEFEKATKPSLNEGFHKAAHD